MTQEHTPGPWELWGNATPSQTISAIGGPFVAQTVGGNDEANARLIAAAPELLEALKLIDPKIGWRSHAGDDPDQYYCEFCGAHHEDYSKTIHKDDCPVNTVRAAITKAEGRT